MPLFTSQLVAVCWLVLSSLWSYPHSLSYFNESIGGPLNGREHLLGSNTDWGQDLRYVRFWMESQDSPPSMKSLRLAYHGLVDPAMLGFQDSIAWPKNKEFSTSSTFQGDSPSDSSSGLAQLREDAFCINAISITFLYSKAGTVRDGSNSTSSPLHLDLDSISGIAPSDWAGYSIAIYRLSTTLDLM